MNKIYSNKEEKAIQRLKQAYETEITKLRKQLELGYDDFLAKKQLNRLKKELRVVKSTQKRTPKLEQLKDKGQLADQLKLRDKEIKLLRERVKLFET
jgi:DNA-binding transcriptional regulator YiaG